MICIEIVLQIKPFPPDNLTTNPNISRCLFAHELWRDFEGKLNIY